MLDRLEQIETRYEDLGRQLADPQLVTDQQKYHKTAKAHRDLEAVVESTVSSNRPTRESRTPRPC